MYVDLIKASLRTVFMDIGGMSSSDIIVESSLSATSRPAIDGDLSCSSGCLHGSETLHHRRTNLTAIAFVVVRQLAIQRLKPLFFIVSFQIPYHNLLLVAFTNMKVLLSIIALACSQVAAFTSAPTMKNSPRTILFAEYEPLEGEGKINLKVDLDSPKVATMVRVLSNTC